MTEQTYRAAGVDLDAAQAVKERIGAIVRPTHGPQVLGGVGGFGAMYQLAGYRDPVLVSSTDGVGTKLKLAIMMGRYDTIGEDLVNACVNDIIVSGARPLFFLDYLALAELEKPVVESLIQGMARACSEVGCALIGGETAQMPGLYARGDFDMAGFV
ncbi:MAG: phosphoribosylformylglycinamidine cyclo-ligase, partial [Chloroflexi bacterium]|nr:phosphoribosylformylglycinamidine cyclo-ligase [Chloroflexota bacterium]